MLLQLLAVVSRIGVFWDDMVRAILVFILVGVTSARGDDSQPNLLLFLADDMTYTDVGCYGNPDVQTPNLDLLAKEGLKFNRCYNSAPTCSPLRQSLYTGLYPVRNGAHPNHSRVYEGVKSLPHYLEPLGYRVAIVGKRHEAPSEAFPFEFLGGGHGDGGKTPDGDDLPLEAAKEFINRDNGQPWCLVVASNQPHTPWNRGDASQYPPSQLTVPPYLVDTDETREALSAYYAEITYMDGQVGAVIDILEDAEQSDRTAFLWLSEQGSQLPYGKWTCYDMGIHAAALMRWPGVIKADSETEALVSYVDVVPTFLAMAGGEPQVEGFDGKSFVPVIKGLSKAHHEVVFAVHTTRGIYNGSEAYGIRAATDGDWLYIFNLHPEMTFKNVVTHRGREYHSWKKVDSDFARERFASYQHRPPEELFYLPEDPWCCDNRIGKVEGISLPSKMGVWMKQQGDLGDATERDAENRQPDYKPWSKKGQY